MARPTRRLWAIAGQPAHPREGTMSDLDHETMFWPWAVRPLSRLQRAMILNLAGSAVPALE